ncbi:MAG: T9SS type A sorting domain-containing protein [Flavobacteriales bacterium]
MKLLLLFISFFYLTSTFAQAPGSLDLSFAGTGFASYGPVSTTAMDNAQDIVTLPNGKMIYCGTSGTTSNSDIIAVRLNCNGTIDQTFGTNGYFLYNNTAGSDFAYDMELLPSGDILLAGATSITPSNTQFTIIKITANGAIDPTFGVNGVFNCDLATGQDYGRKLLISNNKIILVGTAKSTSSNLGMVGAVQCSMNGVLDLTFGTNGITMMSGTGSLTIWSATLGSNGDIFACGDAYISNVYYPMLAKINPDGTANTTFGTNGVYHTMAWNARFFDVDFDGTKLITSGQNGVGPWDMLIQARSTSTGALVTTFGSAGSTIVDVIQADCYYELLIHPDGSLLACGTTGTAGIGAARDFIISKYSANGVLQTSFGTNGHTITSIGTMWDDAYGMDLYPGNKFVVAGFSAQTNTQHAVARYAYGTATPVPGCMDPLSCNYNCLATVSNGSCLYPNTPCNDGNPNTINDSTDANCNCVGQAITLIPGCMNPLACNYNPAATVDNGTCILPGSPCNDNNPNTMNDSIDANCNCVGMLIVPGCMNPAACNYNPLANIDNNSCLFPGQPCNDNNPNTINDSINPDCNCTGDIIVYGCTDPLSCNYNPLANMNDNTCIYPDAPCDDNNPDTYNDALDSNCNCVGTLYIYGCMDPNACNYDSLATAVGSSTCILPGSPCDDGNPMTINDSLSTDCQCVGIDISGIEELQNISSISPNPTQDQLQITLFQNGPARIEICNIEGRLIQVIETEKTATTIPVVQFARGTYFVKVLQNGSLQVHQILFN